MAKDVYVSRLLIKSKAFNSLTGKASQILLILLTKRVFNRIPGKKIKYYIANNGEINFTYSEAKKYYGFSDGVFKRAIEQLINRGFIQVETNGGLYKQPNKYRFINNWVDYGTSKFAPPKTSKKRYAGIGFQAGNKHGKNCK